MRENKHIHVVDNKLETISSTNLVVCTNLTILIGRCWMLILFSVSLIKVEILWLHIKLICKLERIGGRILYPQKQNEPWIPFIYDLRMLWSPVQNFESALGITHAPTRSLSISSRGPEIDWKRTRVGTIRSFLLWTYNKLHLIPTDPPAGHFYHRNRPNLYLLAWHAIDLSTSIDIVNMCWGMNWMRCQN